MGKRCVAAGCSTAHKDGASLFLFPKNKRVKAIWTRQVRLTRAKWSGPSKYSCLCSKHFTEDSFQSLSTVSGSLGLKRKQMLKPGAIPSIFKKANIAACTRSSKVSEKRLHHRVISDFMANHANDVNELVANENEELLDEDKRDLSKGTQTEYEVSSVKVQAKILPNRNKRIQVETVKCDISIQCELLKEKPISYDAETQCHTDNILDDDDSCSTLPETEDYDDSMDMSFECDSDTSSISTDQEDSENNPLCQRKYIIYESCLMELFTNCFVCHNPATISTEKMGTFLCVKQVCAMSHEFVWESQPFINDTPAGNVSLSAAIICSGSLPAKVLHLFKFMNCPSISERTYFHHQQSYLHKAISQTWKKHQDFILCSLKREKKPLTVGGDARCDSPGYCAKFGSYTLLELEHNMILDVELVQCNEVGGSSYMEKEGLIRSIKFISDQGLEVGFFVSDRHNQVTKWVRENMKTAVHKYDIWHVAKSFKKKVDKLAKIKDCENVGEWSRSMINHLYWSVRSSKGKSEVIKEKWLSLGNHIHDKHTGHGKLYKNCSHKKIKRKWLKYNSKSSDKLLKIINNKTLVASIMKSSDTYQTSQLEAFHSLILQFAPKHTAFSYQGMMSRLQLAALHYNYNCNREQAVTKSGKERYSILYPKYKKGGFIVRKIKMKCGYDYVTDIADEVYEVVKTKASVDEAAETFPDFLSNSFEKPNKEEAILQHKSRFSKL